MKQTFKYATAAVMTLATALTAPAQQPSALTDSITEAAATFIVGNMRDGIDMVLQNLEQMGLEADSARIVQLVSTRITESTDDAAYRAAATYLTTTADRLSQSRENEFMEAARQRPGAEVLDGGVVMETLEPGSGATMIATDVVSFNYRGAMPGGTVFDDNAGQPPLTSRVSDLVPGMSVGLTHMRKGGTYRLTIPSAMAYGPQGAGGIIPPNTPLEFTVEVVEIIPAAAQ